MFLVGVTGQFITLILAVSLPLVCFLSGNKITDHSQDGAVFFQFEQAEVINVQASTIQAIDFAELVCDQIEEPLTHFISEKLEFTTRFVRLKTYSLFQGASGNKAPPIFS